MNITIPVKVFAIAAFVCADRMNEDPAYVFDEEDLSIARYLAIEAVHRVYPRATLGSIASSFGLLGSTLGFARRMRSMRLARWWNEWAVIAAEQEIRRAIKMREDDENPEPKVALEEQPGTGFTPRKMITTKVVYRPARRPANVTAMLMGDPGAGNQTHRVMTNQMSRGVN